MSTPQHPFYRAAEIQTLWAGYTNRVAVRVTDADGQPLDLTGVVMTAALDTPGGRSLLPADAVAVTVTDAAAGTAEVVLDVPLRLDDQAGVLGVRLDLGAGVVYEVQAPVRGERGVAPPEGGSSYTTPGLDVTITGGEAPAVRAEWQAVRDLSAAIAAAEALQQDVAAALPQIEGARDQALTQIDQARTGALNDIDQAGTAELTAIAQAGQDERDAIQQAGTDAVQAVEEAETTRIDQATQAGVQAVQQQQTESVQAVADRQQQAEGAIATREGQALSAIEQQEAQSVEAVVEEGDAQEGRVRQVGNEEVGRVRAVLGVRPPRVLVPAPTGYGGDLSRLHVYRRGRAYEAEVDLDGLIPEGTTYYVDPVAGSDDAAGTNPGEPVQSVAKAINLLNASAAPGVIHLAPGWYHMVEGPRGRSIQQSVAILCPDGDATLTLSLPGDWQHEVGAVYRHTHAPTTSGEVPRFAYDRQDLDEQGIPRPLALVDTLEECETTPGTYHLDGETIYAHARDGRNLSADAEGVEYTVRTRNLRANADTVYVKGVRLFGGGGPIVEKTAAGLLILDQCVVAHSVQHGIYLDHADARLIALDSIVAYSGNDGINYRLGSQGIEVRCLVYDIGRNDTSGGSNCSTQHHGGWTARVLSQYLRSRDRTIHDIGAGGSWNVASVAGQTTGDPSNSYAWLCGDTSPSDTTMWLEGCAEAGGVTVAYGVRAGSTMRLRDTPAWGRPDLLTDGTMEPY